MHKERLAILAKHLDTVRPEAFNLAAWRCGSAACAVGHACTIPEFTAAGLELNGHYSWPSFRYSVSWEAVEEFFDLTRGQAFLLFSEDAYNHDYARPTDVAGRIYTLIGSA